MRLHFITWLSESSIILYAIQSLRVIVEIVLFHYNITQYMSYESCIVWMYTSLGQTIIHELQNCSVFFVLISFPGGKDTELHCFEWSIFLKIELCVWCYDSLSLSQTQDVPLIYIVRWYGGPGGTSETFNYTVRWNTTSCVIRNVA